MSDLATVRSMLFVPADDMHKLDKARSSGAGGVIADLEDGVAAARNNVARSVLSSLGRWERPPLLMVRIAANEPLDLVTVKQLHLDACTRVPRS